MFRNTMYNLKKNILQILYLHKTNLKLRRSIKTWRVWVAKDNSMSILSRKELDILSRFFNFIDILI